KRYSPNHYPEHVRVCPQTVWPMKHIAGADGRKGLEACFRLRERAVENTLMSFAIGERKCAIFYDVAGPSGTKYKLRPAKSRRRGNTAHLQSSSRRLGRATGGAIIKSCVLRSW